MVELQMEKLSPIPVTQAVWTMHVIPPAAAATQPATPDKSPMQTVAVTIAPRSAVEELLGQLEGQGFMADRLEVPELDQLEATDIREDGAWIYPSQGDSNRALVAWWYGGVLQNLALLTVSGPDPAVALRDQLMQMAWGGELEDWLTSPPLWHLVAEGAVAHEWEQWLRTALDQPVQTIAPVSGSALAALNARRATAASPQTNLLPLEFADRYRQKFVDRLWLRGLGAALVLYGVGCVIYFIALGFLRFQTSGVENQVNLINTGYTNALQIKARFDVLKERQELKFAALDCYEKTAELMPEGLMLESLNFSDGKKLMLSGTAPAQQVDSVIDFSGKLRKATKNGQPLFSSDHAVPLITHVNPVNSTVTWSFGSRAETGGGAMNSYLSRLNPTERRFVVGVAMALFLVINIFWVWPHFSDWEIYKNRLNNSRQKLANYRAIIQQTERLKPELARMENEGASVATEDQATEFMQTIQVHARQAGLSITSFGPQTTRTNQFFNEQSQTVSGISGEKQLVDFLYNIGSGNSLVRARAIAVRPDQPRQQLSAGITLVASYQKTRQARPASIAPAARPVVGPGAKPAALPPSFPPSKTAAPPTKPVSAKPADATPATLKKK